MQQDADRGRLLFLMIKYENLSDSMYLQQGIVYLRDH